MEYAFADIEQWVRRFWTENNVFKVSHNVDKPKYYVLEMFPYPSGAGLHVGHPLGYVAGDIVARFKRLKGFNVLHPMGYDSFGLPAEQYAIQTGQHPAITTEENIKRYREQLDKIGFSYDWNREVRTSNPEYYKWTQWIFIQIFNSWYNKETDKAEPIDTLIQQFEKSGNKLVNAANSETLLFSADEWMMFSENEKQQILMNYRLAYLGEAFVNWCPALGTVLANDEVKDRVSERGGYPVERKLMKQWSMRITAYAERLLKGLDTIDWSDALKETQRNWIGKSDGCSVTFTVDGSEKKIEVFTTRPDTIFGVTFVTLSPEHELVAQITTQDKVEEVAAYIAYAKSRSERERMSEVKKVTGQFTGAHVIHPFNGEKVPVWIGDYVLSGYGTGAVMGVPAHDSRDYAFAKHFGLPVLEVVSGGDVTTECYVAKEGILINSDFLNGLQVKEAISKAITEIERTGIGKGKVNYKLRDAVFGRQRYWGEPIPVYYKDGIPYAVDEKDLPIVLPDIDQYKPTETGEPPLARAKDFTYKGYELEKTTMPGWAGSSWYFLRYMDPHNSKEFVSAEKLNYWKDIDLYIGGSEHGTGHLLYVRFWTKFLKDLGYINIDEPAKKLVNQGMIQGRSALIYRSSKDRNLFYGVDRYGDPDMSNNEGHVFSVYVDVQLLDSDILSLRKLKTYKPEFNEAKFVNDKTEITVERQTEKMSKSKYNVINPDDVIDKYGADCFRMYEMFLGPIELSKPWDTQGIDGVSRFLRKFWRLFFDEQKGWQVTDETATPTELKVLHKTIKKIEDDIERLSFNTSVSAFMVCVNELTECGCHKRIVLEPLCLILHSFAPHITEYLYSKLGHTTSIADAVYPSYNEALLVENAFEYPISINGKPRTKLEFTLDAPTEDIEKVVLNNDIVLKWLEGKTPKKFIFVKGRMINIVV